ncbi:MAG TPA: YceI family protein [Lacibacter sp.]|nr:YceI family protein [Lacibacter sp.]HMO90504.1 YceI family protein [Lacibacter sp.]HMP86603.1 YceI family protein [Lacibacter sp.]
MATYKIDAAHSEILFKVKHLMITTVTGQFKTFDATLTAETENFSDAQVSFTADINSIDTRNEQRDGHLKSDDFFNAEQFPQLSFASAGVTPSGDGFELTGNLTIRDVTRPVTLKASYNGLMVDPWGQTKVGFEAEGTIKRKEFGLSWDAVTEAGGVVVSDDVKLLLNVQFIKQ